MALRDFRLLALVGIASASRRDLGHVRAQGVFDFGRSVLCRGGSLAGALGAAMMKQIEGVVAGSAIALIGVPIIAPRRNRIMPLLLAIRNRAQ
jgi:hypothetical protein